MRLLYDKPNTQWVSRGGLVVPVSGVNLPVPDLVDFLSTDAEAWWRIAASDAPQDQKDVADEVLDGSNDQVQIASALGVQDHVLLSDGTFAVDGQLAADLAGRTDVRLQGQGIDGTELVTSFGASTAEDCVHLYGQLHIDSSQPYDSFSEGATIIPTNTDLTGSISAGDYIATKTSPMFNPLRSSYTRGQWFQVDSISSTQIVVTEAAFFDHTVDADARLYRFSFVNGLTLADFTVRQGPVDERQRIMHLQFGKGVTVARVRAEGNDGARSGIQTDRCVDVLYVDTRSQDCADSTAPSGTQGYGAYVRSSWRVEFRRHHGLRDRHAVELDGGSWAPLCHNTKYVECEADDCWSAGISTHGGALHHESVDCKARWCGGGHIYRGAYNRIIRPKSVGSHSSESPTGVNESYTAPLRIGEGSTTAASNSDGVAGWGLEVRDVDLDYDTWSGHKHDGIRIDDPVIDGVISGGDVLGWRDFGVHFRYDSDIDGLLIENLHIVDEDGNSSNQVDLGSGTQSGTVTVQGITP